MISIDDLSNSAGIKICSNAGQQIAPLPGRRPFLFNASNRPDRDESRQE